MQALPVKHAHAALSIETSCQVARLAKRWFTCEPLFGHSQMWLILKSHDDLSVPGAVSGLA